MKFQSIIVKTIILTKSCNGSIKFEASKEFIEFLKGELTGVKRPSYMGNGNFTAWEVFVECVTNDNWLLPCGSYNWNSFYNIIAEHYNFKHEPSMTVREIDGMEYYSFRCGNIEYNNFKAVLYSSIQYYFD